MAVPVVAVAVQGALAFLQTKKGRAILAGLLIIIVLVPLLLLIGAVAALAMLGQQASGAAQQEDADRCVDPPGYIAPLDPNNPDHPDDTDSPGPTDGLPDLLLPPDGGLIINGQTWDPDQVANMRTIIGVAKTIDFGTPSIEIKKQAALVALATARQESTFRNLAGGDRDSVGLMQQRPSMGWGTGEQVIDPLYATTAFYLGGAGAGNNGLVSISGWANMRITDAAQAVQASGFPEAYQPHQPLALAIVANLWDSSPPVDPWPGLPGSGAADPADPGAGQGPGGIDCAPGYGGIVVPSGEWTHPLPGVAINSTFRMRLNPATGVYQMHPGVDMPAVCGTPIYAAKDGVVIHSGGPNEGNTGHLIEVDHGEGVSTRYVHSYPDGLIAQAGDQVQAGELIAEVGADGDVTGCHLHFELKVNGQKINPVPYLEERGVPMPISHH